MRIIVTGANGFVGRALVEARAFRQALDEDGLQVALLPGEDVTGVPTTLLERRAELAARLAGLTDAHPGHQAYDKQLAETASAGLEGGAVASIALATKPRAPTLRWARALPTAAA